MKTRVLITPLGYGWGREGSITTAAMATTDRDMNDTAARLSITTTTEGTGSELSARIEERRLARTSASRVTAACAHWAALVPASPICFAERSGGSWLDVLAHGGSARGP